MEEPVPTWCSWCFRQTIHTKIVDGSFGGVRRAIHKCSYCQHPTAACRTPGCTKMACASEDIDHHFCATHRGEIASFEAQSKTIDDPCMFEQLFESSDRDVNMPRQIKRGATFVAAMALTIPLVKAGAVVFGSIYGTKVLGLTGAAAKGAGLAKIGGGALTTGNGGMAAGLFRLTSLGTLLSAARNWHLSNAYFSELAKDFKVELLRPGRDPALICIDGFLTQTSRENETEAHNDAWLKGLGSLYEGHAIYRVRWPAKTKWNGARSGLGTLIGGAIPTVLGGAVSRASLAAASALKSGPAAVGGAAMVAATNPWSIALNNSKKRASCLPN